MVDSAPRRKELRRLDLAVIIPSPDNDREDLGDLSDLIASIRDHGIDTAPKVTPHSSVPPGHFLTVFGHRRLEAARRAGLREVDVIIESGLDDDEIERMRGEENLSRADLPPLDEARVYARRARKINPATGTTYTVGAVATFFSKSQGHVSRRLALLQLPPSVQTLVDQGRIGNTDAYALSQLHEHPTEIVVIVDRHLAGDLDVSIAQAVTDAKVELGVTSRSSGRRPAPVPAPPPAKPTTVFAPPSRRPSSERTIVTLQVRLRRDTYDRMVRTKLHGGRYGFARWAAEHLTAMIDELAPPQPSRHEVAEMG
jgi:ParB/RepB/Spo0J family partition protein